MTSRTHFRRVRWLGGTVAGIVALVALLVAGAASAVAAAPPLPDPAIHHFAAPFKDQAGNEENRAGVHPFLVENVIVPPEAAMFTPESAMKDVIVEMPVGFVGNPQDFPTCRPVQLEDNACPPASQVGTFEFAAVGYENGLSEIAGNMALTGLYNMVTKPGQPARFGTTVALKSAVVYFEASVRPDDYGITIRSDDISNLLAIPGTKVTMWGVPADPVHDAKRFADGQVDASPNAAGVPRRPFLTMPTHCTGEPLVTKVTLRTWDRPDLTASTTYEGPPLVGCENLDFSPSLTVTPDHTVAARPVGLTIDLKQRLIDAPDASATAHLKDVTVALPEGVSINSGAGAGLEACTQAQIGLGNDEPVACPEASRIGDVIIDTPVLDEPMTGGVFQAEQDRNPFGSTFAIYMAPESKSNGVLMKLAGEVKADPVTGRITTTFLDNPQQPFSRLQLKLKGGPRGLLVNPSTCGVKQTEWTMTSWAGQSASSTDSFTVDQGCPSGEFSPSLLAGTASPAAGASSPFSLNVARSDADGQLKSLRSIELPEGLLAHVGSVPLCGDAAAAAGNCPEGSRIGQVQIAAGAGSSPLWLPAAGKEPTAVYLTGPYKGAPYGLSIRVPAQTGPYDLGTVVVRTALHVDELTTAITTGIEESRIYAPDGSLEQVIEGAMPTILKGIPLNLRELRVVMDRDGFMVNPTNCSVQRVAVEAVSTEDRTAGLSNRFRTTDCAKLGFAPRFAARILDRGRRSTLRSFHPRTRFTLVPRKGDANIGAARVVLPSSTLLDQANLGTTCTRPQMAANDCPEASIVGHARAWSPLLQRPVQGPVYLAANGGVRPLPDLAAVMDGEIRVRLMGEISTLRRGRTARLQNTFRAVPDAPVSRFVLTMRGGAKRGLLVNSTDLCRTNERGVAVFRGQNGRTHRLRPRVATTFRGCAKVRRQAARRSTARKAAARKAMVRKAAARSAAREVR